MHAYQIKQQFNEEAEQLYRNKVLIKRERTRDLAPRINNISARAAKKNFEQKMRYKQEIRNLSNKIN